MQPITPPSPHIVLPHISSQRAPSITHISSYCLHAFYSFYSQQDLRPAKPCRCIPPPHHASHHPTTPITITTHHRLPSISSTFDLLHRLHSLVFLQLPTTHHPITILASPSSSPYLLSPALSAHFPSPLLLSQFSITITTCLRISFITHPSISPTCFLFPPTAA